MSTNASPNKSQTFTPLVWREQLAVGHEQIDTDHRHLIALVNRVQELFVRHGSVGELTLALEALHQYTREHFAREEAVQRAVGFPEAEAHHRSHQQLIARLEALTGDILLAQSQHTDATALPEPTRQRLLQLLRDWLIQHVVQEDLKMRPYLRSPA